MKKYLTYYVCKSATSTGGHKKSSYMISLKLKIKKHLNLKRKLLSLTF
jgi:hypothetical protein